MNFKNEYEHISVLDKPEEAITDLLKRVEEKTIIRFDYSTLLSLYAIVKSFVVEPIETTICMPADFYSIAIIGLPIVIEMRYCPCPNCNIITYIDICYEAENLLIAEFVGNQFFVVAPDIPIYLSNSRDSVFSAKPN